MKLYALLKILRPVQWLKNLIIFFPPFLGGEFFEHGMFLKGIVPFAAFCFASNSSYVLNDILDRNRDSNHPIKKNRPIPSGEISVIASGILSLILLICSILLAFKISALFLFLLLAYLVISTSYSLVFKSLPIIDLFCVSAGFLLRLQGGGEAFGIVISEWLFMSVFLLSIFLSTGKRLSEKNTLGEMAGSHRKALLSYPSGYLDGTMYMTGSAVLVTYTLYIIAHNKLVYTVPLCCFGLMRYILRVKSGLGGDPTESLLKDLPLLVTGLLWVVMVGWGLYG
jgi:decaprenyl-phosphate phosphoribosyltransferase